MKFTEIYNNVIVAWPDKISISDAQNIGEEGGYFQKLSTESKIIEDKFENISKWHSLMVWAIFSGLHDQAMKSFKEGLNTISKTDIDIVAIENIFSTNLFNKDTDYYEDIKSSYENDL